MGKTFGLAAIVCRVLQQRASARALFLAPAALCAQIGVTLERMGAPYELVDRLSLSRTRG